MKKRLLLCVLLIVFVLVKAPAQYVRVRVGFPAGASIGAPGPRPFAGAVWIGPEWRWRGGRYHYVPGYWSRPRRHHSMWVPGHWKYGRHGYRWMPGHWR
jgi:hypothetical protein